MQIIMTLFKIIFIVLLCIPVGYFAWRIWLKLVQEVKESSPKRRRRKKPYGR